jgi:hypothetical protein
MPHIFCVDIAQQKMTVYEKPAKKVRRLQRDRGLKSPELARAADLTPGSLRNVIWEVNKSKKARQRLSNALCATIWPEIRPETAIVKLPAKTELVDLSKPAAKLAAEFPPGAVKIVNQNTIRIVRPVDVIIKNPRAAKTGGKTRKREK